MYTLNIALFFTATLLLVYLVAPTLNPFEKTMISFHDPTQAGRVTSFVASLRAGHIPPRIAPEFSFNLGMPVFNFYAPTAYWISSVIALLGASSGMAIKMSFLLAIFASFYGMYYFLKQLFLTLSENKDPSVAAVLGASVYVSSTYFATEIMVRGNLAECWFLALLPLGFGLVIHNSKSDSVSVQVLTPVVLALLFSAHNVLSLFAIPLVIVFLTLFPNKLKNLITVCLAVLLDSYFFIPAVLESSFVQAATVAKEYDYNQHFLCPWQLWSAHGWQFGGSLSGCEADTMSFKLGKLQLILAIVGLGLFVVRILFTKKTVKKNWPLCFIALFSVGALVLTLEQSRFFWNFFSSIMSLFQFPWRFIVFGLFGVAVFSGYVFHVKQIPFITNAGVFVLLFALFLPGRKYFIKPAQPIDQYEQSLDSTQYRTRFLAYKVKEYVPWNLEYIYWSTFDPHQKNFAQIPFDYTKPAEFSGEYQITQQTAFDKQITVRESGLVTVNVHYFPFWKIFVNEIEMTPNTFDLLVRPMIDVSAGDTVRIFYQQTLLERVANVLSLIGVLILSTLAVHKKFHLVKFSTRPFLRQNRIAKQQ